MAFYFKKKPTNKTTFIFVNNTVCVANSQKLDLSTKYMRYHDTKPPLFFYSIPLAVMHLNFLKKIIEK